MKTMEKSPNKINAEETQQVFIPKTKAGENGSFSKLIHTQAQHFKKGGKIKNLIAWVKPINFNSHLHILLEYVRIEVFSELRQRKREHKQIFSWFSLTATPIMENLSLPTSLLC